MMNAMFRAPFAEATGNMNDLACGKRTVTPRYQHHELSTGWRSSNWPGSISFSYANK